MTKKAKRKLESVPTETKGPAMPPNAITMTYEQLRGLMLFSMPLIGKIMNTPLPGKTTMKLKKIFDQLFTVAQTVQKEGIAKLEVFAKKDDKGEIIRPANDPFGFEVDDAQTDAFQAAKTEFEKTVFSINRPRIPFNEISSINFTIQELHTLETLVLDDEAGEGQTPTALQSV